ncbi:MAG: hypothetical protein GAK31_00232 [Stenotrophomonas maltophilia]|uniref:Metallo-beta-lactamase domain-containing protein n=1 Tax=Stenotrophomonas maltophilia TaxID=40324 RepID=A0A7V8FJ32_STEMA|nr:MAG: hypothetical protein GAK31_00232 [Stenotrophomonas maltophilia]
MAEHARKDRPARRWGRTLRRVVGWSALGTVSLLLALLAAFLVSGCTAFGGTPDGPRLVRATQSPQWSEGQFQNPQPLWSDSRGAWRRLLFGTSPQGQQPSAPVPTVNTDPALLRTPPASGLRTTWFGHSSALVEIDGSRVLVDLLWSERASPVSWAGPRRWFAPPIALADLPAIDVVVISHDHVDHLDYASITAMRSWNTRFVVPLGLARTLRSGASPRSASPNWTGGSRPRSTVCRWWPRRRGTPPGGAWIRAATRPYGPASH